MDRSRPGSKHHLIVSGDGTPLAVSLTAANRHDVTQLIELVDHVPPVGSYGRFRPAGLFADRAYDSRAHRTALRERGITSHLARRKTEHGSGLGTHRWQVERTFAWLHCNRYLARRHARRADIHEAMLTLACGLICFNRVIKFC